MISQASDQGSLGHIETGFARLPICTAKTQYPSLAGASVHQKYMAFVCRFIDVLGARVHSPIVQQGLKLLHVCSLTLRLTDMRVDF